MTPEGLDPDVIEVSSVSGADSWTFGNDSVSACLTRRGAQLAPVRFGRRTDDPVEPYYVAPWSVEEYEVPDDELMIKLMRGDAFCLPFGFPSRDDTAAYPLHGDITSHTWTFEGSKRNANVNTFSFAVDARAPSGRVDKTIALVDGHNIIYAQHTLSGFSGRYPVGHHPMLAVPQEEGSVLVSVGPSVSGHTWPDPFGTPSEPAYAAMAVGVDFASPREVPTVFAQNPVTAIDAFPARQGYTDAVLWRATDPAAGVGWSAATFTTGGYLWFSLKDPRVLPMTIVFMGNGGRHYAPWSGRERILSLQDTCSYFGTGAVRSRNSNPLSDTGTPTALTLSPTAPTSVKHIQGVVKIPAGFGRVREVVTGSESATFIDEAGATVTTQVYAEFIHDGLPALTR